MTNSGTFPFGPKPAPNARNPIQLTARTSTTRPRRADRLPRTHARPCITGGDATWRTLSDQQVGWSRVTDEVGPKKPLKVSLTFGSVRSEEHTSELQSLRHLVCRLLLE